MSEIENKSAAVYGPFPNSSVTGVTSNSNYNFAGGGVFSLAVGSTVVSCSVPYVQPSGSVVGGTIHGSFVRFLADTSNMQIGLNWGVSGSSLTYGALSTINANGALTSSAARGGTLVAGTPEHFIIPPRNNAAQSVQTRLWISAIAQASGSLEFYVSEGKTLGF